MGVSTKRGTRKSSILIGLFLINHPYWGTSISTWIIHPSHKWVKIPIIVPYSSKHLLRQYLELFFEGLFTPSQRVFGALGMAIPLKLSPTGNFTGCYRKWPMEIVDIPIERWWFPISPINHTRWCPSSLAKLIQNDFKPISPGLIRGLYLYYSYGL